MRYSTLLVLLINLHMVYGQSVGINNTTPNNKAALDIRSEPTGPQGVILPRISHSGRIGLNTSGSGSEVMLVYDTTDSLVYQWDGNDWSSLSDFKMSGDTLYNLDDNFGFGMNSAKEKVSVNGNILATGDFVYNSPKIGYLSLGASQFRLRTTNGTENYALQSGGAYASFLSGLSTIQAEVYAPVNLPHGSRIRKITAYVYDNNITVDVSTELYRVQVTSDIPQQISLVSTSGINLTSVQNLDGPANTAFDLVNNSEYSYFISWQESLGGDVFTRIYAVVIEYEKELAD